MLSKTGLVYFWFTAISSRVQVLSSPLKCLFLGGSCITTVVHFRSMIPSAAQSLSRCNPRSGGAPVPAVGQGFFPGVA